MIEKRFALWMALGVMLLGGLLGVRYWWDAGNLFGDRGIPNSGEESREKKIPFRPETVGWEEVASSTPWGPRDSHAIQVFRDKIWIIGGLNANGVPHSVGRVPYEKAEYFNDVWYSDDGITWVRAAEHAPWPPARSQHLVAFNGKLFLFGGWGPDGYIKDAWMSEDGISWKSVPLEGGLPELEGADVIVFRNKLFLLGGVRYTDRKIFNQVWSSDDGVSWTLENADAPWFPRWDHAVAEFNGSLWLWGGMDLAGNEFNDVWKSGDGVEWERVAEHAPWQARQGHTALVYQNRMWSIGRLNDDLMKGENDIWFTEDGYVWEKTNSDPPWLGREDHGAVVFRDRMWVLGGMDRNWNWEGDVWRSVFP